MCFGSGAFGSATEVSPRGIVPIALAVACFVGEETPGSRSCPGRGVLKGGERGPVQLYPFGLEQALEIGQEFRLLPYMGRLYVFIQAE